MACNLLITRSPVRSRCLQITRGARPHDNERDSIAGKALFTSPVLKGHLPSRTLETVDEASPGYEDVVGRSPTADL